MFYKIFLFLSLLVLRAVHSNPAIVQHAIKPVENEGRFLLEYTGSINGYINIDLGVQVAMDTSIGFRYDVTFQRGGAVMSHVAFFYKFSSPYQVIEYNYLSHQTQLIKSSNSAKDEDLSVIGQEQIDSFSCTHLQKSNDNEQQDYWMSKAVPGFTQLYKILKGIDANLAMMVISQTVFKWGGIVKPRVVSKEKNGKATTLNVKLIEAETGLVFTDKDFEVPAH